MTQDAFQPGAFQDNAFQFAEPIAPSGGGGSVIGFPERLPVFNDDEDVLLAWYALEEM